MTSDEERRRMAPEEIKAALQRADELERLAQAATEGPWEGDDPDTACKSLIVSGKTAFGNKIAEVYFDDCDHAEQEANERMIIHARNNAEQHVSDVRRLAEELEHCRSKLRRIIDKAGKGRAVEWARAVAADGLRIELDNESCEPSS